MTVPFSLLPQFAVIVAGGSGNRMGTAVPKQFLPVGGVPIVIRTITRFFEYSSDIQLILVLPEKDLPAWETISRQHPLPHPIQVVTGGATRFQSVRNGLQIITDEEGLAAIHDGVRPFVPVQTIRESFEVAYQQGCAIAAVALKDSIRQVAPPTPKVAPIPNPSPERGRVLAPLSGAGGASQSVDRTQFRLVQTPQTFRLSVIRKGFAQPEQPDFTDDASVAERAGYPITLIEGTYQNIKITTPEDLLWAEAYVKLMG